MNTKRFCGPAALLIAALLAPPVGAQPVDDIELMREVLLDQQEAWNEGDLNRFMGGYWKSDSLTFASGGAFNKGWQTTLDNYKTRYPDRASMGVLNFTLFDIRLLSSTNGFVFGRYELERENDRPTGVFTLLMAKIDGEWKVTFDHTSAKVE